MYFPLIWSSDYLVACEAGSVHGNLSFHKSASRSSRCVPEQSPGGVNLRPSAFTRAEEVEFAMAWLPKQHILPYCPMLQSGGGWFRRTTISGYGRQFRSNHEERRSRLQSLRARSDKSIFRRALPVRRRAGSQVGCGRVSCL